MYDGEGARTSYVYDKNGNMLSVRDGNGVGKDCVYDSLDREISCTDTKGDTTSKEYDRNGNIIRSINGKGDAMVMTYDTLDRMMTSTNEIGATTQYFYDSRDNIIKRVDAEYNQTLYGYSLDNQLLTTTYAGSINEFDDGSDTVTCAYDAMNREISCIDQEGQEIKKTYDLAGRLINRRYFRSDGSFESADLLYYDASSRLISATKGRYGNTVSLTYDQRGLVVHERLRIINDYFDMVHEYDLDNRRVQTQYPSRTFCEYVLQWSQSDSQ